jgi:hypothetical protein
VRGARPGAASTATAQGSTVVALASLAPVPDAGGGALVDVLASTDTDQVRRLAARAREDLRARVRDFLEEEAHGYLGRIAAYTVEPMAGDRLRATADRLATVVRTARGRPW